MRDAAGNLEFEEAGRLRDEIKRLQSVALAIGDDPMARQMDIEATAGSYAGERPFGRAANLPSTRSPQADWRRHGPARLGRWRSATTASYLSSDMEKLIQEDTPRPPTADQTRFLRC
jgi:UvrB/uvrC motif